MNTKKAAAKSAACDLRSCLRGAEKDLLAAEEELFMLLAAEVERLAGRASIRERLVDLLKYVYHEINKIRAIRDGAADTEGPAARNGAVIFTIMRIIEFGGRPSREVYLRHSQASYGAGYTHALSDMADLQGEAQL